MEFVDVLPAAPIKRLQERGPTYVGEDLIPVQREDEVPHGLVGCSGRMLVVGQQNGRWNGYAQLAGERVIEKLVIRGPPKRIVDDDGALQRGVLQVGTIKRNILRDAVDDHVILSR